MSELFGRALEYLVGSRATQRLLWLTVIVILCYSLVNFYQLALLPVPLYFTSVWIFHSALPIPTLLFILLKVISEHPIISTTIWPDVLPPSIFLIFFVLARITVATFLSWSPFTTTLSMTCCKVSIIWWSIWPIIFSPAMESSIHILPSVHITIRELLDSVSMFYWFYESAIIEFTFTEFQNSLSLFFVMLELATVVAIILSIIEDTYAMFFTQIPLPFINTLSLLRQESNQSTWSIFLPFIELSIITVFIRDQLKSFSSFLPLSLKILLPSSYIKLSIIMPNNSLFGIYSFEYNTVFVFFHVEVIFWDPYVENLADLVWKMDELLLSDCWGRCGRKFGNFNRVELNVGGF